MIDSIGAIGVLLTMITILFTLWQPEIEEKLKVDVDIKKGNEVVIKDIKMIHNFNISILYYGTLIIFIIMALDIMMIMHKTIQIYRLEGFNVIKHYKSIYAIYLLLWIFSLILFIHIYSMKKLIKNKIKKLEA